MSRIDLTKEQIEFYASIDHTAIPKNSVLTEVTHLGQTITAFPDVGGTTGYIEVSPNKDLSVVVPDVKDWVGGLVLQFVVQTAKKQAPDCIPPDRIQGIKAKLTLEQAEFFKDIDVGMFPQGTCRGNTWHKGKWVRLTTYPFSRADVRVGEETGLKPMNEALTLWCLPCTANVVPYDVMKAIQRASVELLAERAKAGAKDLIANTPKVQQWNLSVVGDDAVDLYYNTTALRYRTTVRFKPNGTAFIQSHRLQGAQEVLLFEDTLPTTGYDQSPEKLADLLSRYTEAVIAAAKV